MRHHVTRRIWPSLTLALVASIGVVACGEDDGPDSDATRGGPETGGGETGGGPASGGRATGGANEAGNESEAGAVSEGGAVTGGRATGGAPVGGSPGGGAPAGGAPAGGSPAGGSPAGGAPAGGSPAGGAPAGGTGGLDCEQVDCVRPYECVEECGDEPFNNGCCPCPEGTFDSIVCGTGGAGTGGIGPGGAGGASTGGVGPGGASVGGASTGGVGPGGAGAGGVGGLPASCDIGCTPTRECDEDGIVWECGGDYDHQAMLDLGCVDLATGIQRFCCPLTAFAECLPRIEIDRDVYAPEEQIDPRWENPTDESIFLPGCGTVALEQQNGDAWEYIGPMVICAWEGVAVEVRPGARYVEPHAAIVEAGTYRFTGGYSVGCTPGEALSEAGCSRGPIPVVSRAFAVE